MSTPLTEEENQIEVANVKHPRCVICTLAKLSAYDKKIFFRRTSYDDFMEEVTMMGYSIPEIDFKKHAMNHIYVVRSNESGPVQPNVDVLSSMITSLSIKVADMKTAGDTDQSEYLKTIDLLKSLIELKGKFDGAYTKIDKDTTDDFKTKMMAQIEKAMASKGKPNGIKEVGPKVD